MQLTVDTAGRQHSRLLLTEMVALGHRVNVVDHQRRLFRSGGLDEAELKRATRSSSSECPMAASTTALTWIGDPFRRVSVLRTLD